MDWCFAGADALSSGYGLDCLLIDTDSISPPNTANVYHQHLNSNIPISEVFKLQHISNLTISTQNN